MLALALPSAGPWAIGGAGLGSFLPIQVRTFNRYVITLLGQRQLRGAGLEVALLGDAQGAAGGQTVGGMCRLPVTCHVQQVCADRVDAVVTGERGVGFRRCELLETRLRAVDHRDGDEPVEGDHRSGRDALQHVVEPEDLPPVGVLEAGRLVVDGGDRRLQLVGADSVHRDRRLHEDPGPADL